MLKEKNVLLNIRDKMNQSSTYYAKPNKGVINEYKTQNLQSFIIYICI